MSDFDPRIRERILDAERPDVRSHAERGNEEHVRLLPYAIADGATNMAADETLVHSAVDGVASLRFYGWTSATVSLGYFQSCQVRLMDPTLTQLPWVRRPSGGATLVHHHELTYALALPPGRAWQSGESWLLRMHRIIVQALDELGLAGKIALVDERPSKYGDVLCFEQFTIGDVLCLGHKIVGSAQRKHRQALVQHGSILLAQSDYAPALPGVRELAGLDLNAERVREAVARAIADQTNWRMEEDNWTAKERQLVDTLVAERYGNPAWNERR